MKRTILLLLVLAGWAVACAAPAAEAPPARQADASVMKVYRAPT